MKPDELRSAIAAIPPGYLRIRTLFALTGKRQRIVARRLGVQQSDISKFASGDREPSADERRGLAKVFGLTVADIFGKRAA